MGCLLQTAGEGEGQEHRKHEINEYLTDYAATLLCICLPQNHISEQLKAHNNFSFFNLHLDSNYSRKSERKEAPTRTSQA